MSYSGHNTEVRSGAARTTQDVTMANRLKRNPNSPSPAPAGSAPPRETRKWWAVTDTGVRQVTGYSCKPHNPTTWWCPEAGYSLTEGHHLFDTEKKALKKAITETNDELDDLQKHLASLLRQNTRAEARRENL